MSLISLKRYLTSAEGEPTYRKVVSILLNGIADYAISTDSTELESFRGELQAILASIEGESNPEQLLVAAGATAQAMDSYHKRTTRAIRRQAAELQKMISMLTQTVITISGGSERSAEALSQIKGDLERAGALEDVQMVKRHLADCLEKVQDEVSRQKKDAEAVVLELQDSIGRARQGDAPAAMAVDVDPITGLPTQASAKNLFHEALRTAGRKYILTLVVQRLQPINARFGNAVGDEVLRVTKRHIESQVIAPGDKLFRWSGPAFVAVMPRAEAIDHIRNSFKRVLDAKIENTYAIGGRSALIPISLAWSVIALIPPAQNIPKFIDNFIAAQVPRDYV